MNINSMLAVSAAIILAGCSTLREPDYDTLIAHRGESVDAPENTLPAYRIAVERGFGFECDIYRSKDGRLFTFHDFNLKRTTGGRNTEKCVEASWADTISKVNVGGWGKWKGSEFDPTRPALLEEVLALARPGRKIYVEVKGGDAAVDWVEDIAKTLAKSRKASPKTVVFICFSAPVCKALKQRLPRYKTYWLTSEKLSADEVIARLREIGADGVDIHFKPEIHDADFVRKIHEAGFEFHVWTVDSLKKARQSFSAGADSLTTNCAKYLLDEYNLSK